MARGLPDAELYVGDEATVDVLRAKADGRHVVHIAAHGFFRPDNPMFSGIRLGAGSYLTLYDLYNLKLPAEMVVLSACVTGRQRDRRRRRAARARPRPVPGGGGARSC